MTKTKRTSFPKFEETDLRIYQFQGLDDPRTHEYTMLNVSSAIQEDVKEDFFAKEYIASYITSLEDLARVDDEEREKMVAFAGVNGKRVHKGTILLHYSRPIVILYLARHAVELIIKRALIEQNISVNPEHNVVKLWDQFVNKVGYSTGLTKTDLKNVRPFINVLNEIDSNGTKLRYHIDNNDNYTSDGTILVNYHKFVELTKRLNKLLLENDESTHNSK